MSERKSSRFLIVALVIAPLLGAPTVAVALDDKSVDALSHFLECANLLLSDPAKHAKLCLPSTVTDEQLKGLLPADINTFGAGAGPHLSSSSSSSSSSSQKPA